MRLTETESKECDRPRSAWTGILTACEAKIVSCLHKKTNPTLALGMRKDGAPRREGGLMKLAPTNLGVINQLVLPRFVPQRQFDAVPQS